MIYNTEVKGFGNVCRLFPLPGIVMFPHAVLPLHIFEPRYRELTADALASDGLVTIVQLKSNGDWESKVDPPIDSIACLGKIIQFDRLPDGRFNYLLLGCKRVRLIRELETPTLYRQAEAELVDEIAADDNRTEDIRCMHMIQHFLAWMGKDRTIDHDLALFLESYPGSEVLTDLVAHALGLAPAVKQALLNEPRVSIRTATLLLILRQLTGKTSGEIELEEARERDAGRRTSFPPPFSAN